MNDATARLAAIEARVQALPHHGLRQRKGDAGVIVDADDQPIVVLGTSGDIKLPAGEFFANAPTDMQWLIEQLKEAHERIADLTETTETIRYTADVVCIRGGDVLLIERGWPPHKGKLALPGGHANPGETAQSAAARELLEETGVRVDPEDLVLVDIYDAPDRDPRGRYITAAYVVTVPAGTTAQAGDDAAAVRWVPLDAPGDLAFDHTQIVADAWRQTITR